MNGFENFNPSWNGATTGERASECAQSSRRGFKSSGNSSDGDRSFLQRGRRMTLILGQTLFSFLPLFSCRQIITLGPIIVVPGRILTGRSNPTRNDMCWIFLQEHLSFNSSDVRSKTFTKGSCCPRLALSLWPLKSALNAAGYSSTKNAA